MKSKNVSLKEENDKIKSSLESHTTGYKTFRKLTNAQLKSLQGLDSTEYQMKCGKFELEISKISRLCSGIQKQIGDLRKNKQRTPSSTPRTISETNGTSNGPSCLNDLVSSVCVATKTISPDAHASGHAPKAPVPVTDRGIYDSCTRAASSIANADEASTKDTQTHGVSYGSTKSQSLNIAIQRKYIASESKQPNYSKQCLANNSSSSPVSTSQKPTNPSSGSTGARVDVDIFEGVTRKRNARYYISGIS